MKVEFEGVASQVIAEMKVFLSLHEKKATLGCSGDVEAKQGDPISVQAMKPLTEPAEMQVWSTNDEPIVSVAEAPQYTRDELMAATAPLMDANKYDELAALMKSFGVSSMVEIPEEQFGQLAVELRKLGARI